MVDDSELNRLRRLAYSKDAGTLTPDQRRRLSELEGATHGLPTAVPAAPPTFVSPAPPTPASAESEAVPHPAGAEVPSGGEDAAVTPWRGILHSLASPAVIAALAVAAIVGGVVGVTVSNALAPPATRGGESLPESTDARDAMSDFVPMADAKAFTGPDDMVLVTGTDNGRACLALGVILDTSENMTGPSFLDYRCEIHGFDPTVSVDINMLEEIRSQSVTTTPDGAPEFAGGYRFTARDGGVVMWRIPPA